MIWCLSNARSRDLHFGISFVALRALVREIIPNTIHTHPHRGEWAWFGRQDSPGNSNISKMRKDRNASFNVHFQPRPMHVSSHNAFGLISSFSCHSSFSLFGMRGVIFQSANRAADDSKTYQFVLPLDQGRFRMIQSCGDTDIRY